MFQIAFALTGTMTSGTSGLVHRPHPDAVKALGEIDRDTQAVFSLGVQRSRNELRHTKDEPPGNRGGPRAASEIQLPRVDIAPYAERPNSLIDYIPIVRRLQQETALSGESPLSTC